MSLAVTRTIVEKDGKGFLEFNVSESPIPSESDLKDDEVIELFVSFSSSSYCTVI
jgi:hypothetical protein